LVQVEDHGHAGRVCDLARRAHGARPPPARELELGGLADLRLPVAPVHAPADLRGARTGAGLVTGGLLGSAREGLEDVPERDVPSDPSRDRGGVDLRVLSDARRLHHAGAGWGHAVHRQRDLRQRRRRREHAARRGVRARADRDHGRLPARRQACRRVRGALAVETRGFKILIRVVAALLLVFLYVPLAIIVLYAFNDSVAQAWPIEELTTKWFGIAWRSPQVREALENSLEVATIATLFALALGSAAALRVHRFRFFGRNGVSFLLVLPIALPGIVTAIALNTTINNFRIPFGVLTIVIGHATFCIVVVYNNVIARLRRTPTSLIEASMDLGADGWQTFRYVTFPAIRTALVAGALLAFALSFDEIVVTNFTAGATDTIPRFIYRNLRLPHNRPIVNVVALGVILVMLIPVYVAQRMAGGGDVTATAAKAEAAEV